jgi:alcohol dehydrogenase YqhD (iron-dependent ADH family)
MSYRTSKAKRAEYAKQMILIDQCCNDNNISRSLTGDSYYFAHNGISYRVSNHTIAKSDAGMFNDFGEKVRESYHKNDADVVCFTASKTRIIEIHKDILAGLKLNKRGKVIN